MTYVDRASREERSEFRAFVREHHPDRGGDPEAFVAGLARFGTRPGAAPAPDDQRRYDAPVEIVRTLPLPVRMGVAMIRTWRRRRHDRVQ